MPTHYETPIDRLDCRVNYTIANGMRRQVYATKISLTESFPTKHRRETLDTLASALGVRLGTLGPSASVSPQFLILGEIIAPGPRMSEACMSLNCQLTPTEE